MRMAGQVRPAYFLYHTFWTAIDWLFPPACGGCSKTGMRWCSSCQEKVSRIDPGKICARCGEPDPPGTLCSRCASTPPAYQSLRSFGEFAGPLREALHRLKYQHDIGLGEALSKHLIELYNDFKWDIDAIVPVPLSAARLRDRGYNQADILARPVAYALQRPYRPEFIERVRDTRSQVGLSAVERQLNVDGAFTAQVDDVKGRSVLIIDDVTTTGSTINSCAQALQKAGASAVYGLTLARAVLQAHTDDRLPYAQLNGGKYGS